MGLDVRRSVRVAVLHRVRYVWNREIEGDVEFRQKSIFFFYRRFILYLMALFWIIVLQIFMK